MHQQQLTFDAPLTPSDQPRLSKQLAAVLAVMGDGQWHTLTEVQRGIAGMGVVGSLPGVSARLRDLRKQQHGAHVVERKRTEAPGVFEYRIA